MTQYTSEEMKLLELNNTSDPFKNWTENDKKHWKLFNDEILAMCKDGFNKHIKEQCLFSRFIFVRSIVERV